MSNYTYETHTMDSLLPFIFHDTTIAEDSSNFANWHRNVELICCYAGEGYVKCNGKEIHMLPGNVAIINSDVIHGFGTKSSFSYYCLIIDSSFCKANGVHVEKLQFQPCVKDVCLLETFTQLNDIYRQYRKDRILPHVLAIRCRVMEILCATYTHYLAEEMPVADFENLERVKQAMTYIRQNLQKAFALEEIAEHVGISKFHLSREFKKITGNTIFEFINLLRCAEAKQMIEAGMAVSSAATACGYENASYFTRVFKKCFGILPSAVRTR